MATHVEAAPTSNGVRRLRPRLPSCVAMAATIDSEAYITLFMHACKFPSRTVNGLLLGSVSGGGVSVQKTLPLFHTPLGLAPMLEAALMLVRACTPAVVSPPASRARATLAGRPVLQGACDASGRLLPGERAV